MQDETKADGRFKIADVDVNTLFDFGPAEKIVPLFICTMEA